MAKAKAKAAPVQDEAAEIEVGSNVRFLGYDEDTPDEERVLVEGEVYPVVELPEGEGDDATGYVIRFANPDFNAKKKEHADTNAKFLETEVFEEEIELVDEAEGEEEQEEEAPPAKTTKGKAAAKVAEKPAAKTAAKATAEKPAAKGKAAAKEAPAAKGKAAAKAAEKPAAKGKGKAVVKPEKAEPAPEDDPDFVPELEHEDEEVLALVNESEDLIATAQSLESEAAKNEYLMGGILYHIKREGEWKGLEPEYGEPGGYKKFLMDNFNIDYRKAQYLVEIYVNFQLAEIENPSEVIARLGWTKASKIAKYLPDQEDPNELVATAEENSVVDLSEIIKDTYHTGGTGGDKGTAVKRITCKFVYVEEEGNLVDDILAEAASNLGVTPAQALLQILTEYHAQNAVDAGQGAEEEEEEEEEAPPAKGKGKASAKATTPAKAPARGKARA